MGFWENVKKDVQKGLKEGQKELMEGYKAVKVKAGEISEEGKRRYNVFDLKTKVQKEIAELGGAVYGLSAMDRNPLLDAKVKALISKIQKLEAQISRLEAAPNAPAKKKAAKTKSDARA
ncbi:MAG: hypothetical protein Q8J64_09860 [Thermodesulfovibrionales bacterium]|nr:hypothetical protein [Thermodesulfovibrionales bacterium]